MRELDPLSVEKGDTRRGTDPASSPPPHVARRLRGCSIRTRPAPGQPRSVAASFSTADANSRTACSRPLLLVASSPTAATVPVVESSSRVECDAISASTRATRPSPGAGRRLVDGDFRRAPHQLRTARHLPPSQQLLSQLREAYGAADVTLTRARSHRQLIRRGGHRASSREAGDLRLGALAVALA